MYYVALSLLYQFEKLAAVNPVTLTVEQMMLPVEPFKPKFTIKRRELLPKLSISIQ